MRNTEIPIAISDLDWVLKFLVDNNPPQQNDGYFHFMEVKVHFDKLGHRESYVFAHLIKKLKDDGFVIIDRDVDGDFGFVITWNGRVHNSLGGYSAVFLNQNLSSVLNAKSHRMEKRMVFLTILITLGTLIQAFGVIWQIYHPK